MPTTLTARGQSQRIRAIQLLDRRVIQPSIWYTVPAGKKAIVKGNCLVDNFGSATFVNLEGGGVIIAKWVVAGFITLQTIYPKQLQINVSYPFEVELMAGESIRTSSDTTAGDVDINATIEESPL